MTETILDPPDLSGSTSDAFLRSEADEAEIAKRIADALDEEPALDPDEALSPAFKALREPKLPALERENRARLLMQTPNRLYFYWSLKNNPFHILHRAFGENTGSYTLVAKLINENTGEEDIHAVDASGNWWFNVDADTAYRAEIGFYATNRPYFRALYTNSITTPRKSPSFRAATASDWMVTSDKFAKVLSISGFKQDAFDVAIAGDDAASARNASFAALSRLTGRPETAFEGFDADELRYALTMLAAGATLEDLRFRISDRIFAFLQEVIDLITREKAVDALKAEFDIDESEIFEEFEEAGPAVFGLSLVHFPRRPRRTIKTREGGERPSKLSPLASHTLSGR